MEKQLKDYLHLYLGCEVYTKDFDGVDDYTFINLLTLVDLECGKYDEFKPILRPLSSMTNDEGCQMLFLNNERSILFVECVNRLIYYRTLNNNGRRSRITTDWFPVMAKRHSAFHYLLSKHFDIFDLIEAGLAIDATTLQKEVQL